jgi:hypothetical protein
VQRRGRHGIVLRERVYGWCDVPVRHQPSDLRRRGQWLHRQHDIHLHQRGVQRRGWRGLVLHERVYGWGNVPVRHQPSDLRRRDERLHGSQHHDVHVQWRVGRRHVREFNLGRVAHAQLSVGRDRGRPEFGQLH